MPGEGKTNSWPKSSLSPAQSLSPRCLPTSATRKHVGDGGGSRAGIPRCSVLMCPTAFEGGEKEVKPDRSGNLCVFPALGALTEAARLWMRAGELLARRSELNEACADVSLLSPCSVLPLIALGFETRLKSPCPVGFEKQNFSC